MRFALLLGVDHIQRKRLCAFALVTHKKLSAPWPGQHRSFLDLAGSAWLRSPALPCLCSELRPHGLLPLCSSQLCWNCEPQ